MHFAAVLLFEFFRESKSTNNNVGNTRGRGNDGKYSGGKGRRRYYTVILLVFAL